MDRPISPAFLRQARRIASQYRLVIQPDPDGGFDGWTIEQPLVIGTGRTIEECAQDTFEAQVVAIAVSLELGQRPPAPVSAGKREVQVNIRLNADEKVQIEESARKAGFRSISDYIRTAALRQVS